MLGCGRVGFSPTQTADGERDGAVDPDAPRPVGPRFIRQTSDDFISIAGANNEVALVSSFSGSFTAEPSVDFMGQGFTSSGFVHYNAAGDLVASALLDATGFCDMRAIAFDGADVIVGGFTLGTQSIPAYGACSIATNRQDPIAIKINPSGAQSIIAHWAASDGNAQAWTLAVMPDHTVSMSGIYAVNLSFGATAAPMAGIDPNTWVARSTLTSPTMSTWGQGMSSTSEIHAAHVASAGDELCVIGAHRGSNVTVFGTLLAYVAGYDAWVARVDGVGNPRYVRAFGSAANEPSFGNLTSIVALADGSCIATANAPGDVTANATQYPWGNDPGFVIAYAGDGSVAWTRRFPSAVYIAQLGSRLIATYTQAGDAIVVELDTAGTNDKILGVIAGAGTQSAEEIAQIGPNAVAIEVSTTGELVFGNTTFTTAAVVRAVAVLDI